MWPRHPPFRPARLWSPPELWEFETTGWSDYFRYQRTVRTSIAEVVKAFGIWREIGHSVPPERPNGNSAPSGVTYDFDGHGATVVFENDLALLGAKTLPVTTLDDLGLNVNRATGVGAKSFLSAYTPIDGDHLDVRFSFLTPLSLPDDPDGALSRRSAETTVALFEQDIPIWEHRSTRTQPLLCNGDGPIGAYRKWANGATK